MIKREIKVEYDVRVIDHKVCFTNDELVAGSGKKYAYQVESLERVAIFSSFKNNGTLSKSETNCLNGLSSSDRSRIFKAAEDKLAKQLAIEADTVADMARAIELAKVVNAAAIKINYNPVIEVSSDDDFKPNDDVMVTIKEKDSHSDWYQNGGLGHAVSLYLTRVPRIVEKEARELQAIRRKHQGDTTFDFWKTSYSTQEVRVADHENC